MSIAVKIKSQQLTVRKAREDRIAISLLTVLVSDIERLAKDKDRDVTDEEATMVIRRLLKSNAEMLSILEQRELTTVDIEHEKRILESFLPEQLTEEQITFYVEEIIYNLNPTSKEMGKVMGEIKRRFGASVDMKIASEIVKRELHSIGDKL